MSLPRFDLSGRVALVTGASSGIGRQQAKALARAGACVVLAARRADALAAAVAEIESEGGQAGALAADLADRGALTEIAARAAGAFGPVDILVNAAGTNPRQAAEAVTFEAWDLTMNLNLAVPFFLARELVPAMAEKAWGRVINIASLQTTRAFANGLVYGASKGGIGQLTRAMAEAWSGQGIACNALAPGFFPTELTAALFEDQALTDRLAAQTAIGRNGRLADLDGITVFLAAPASDYITGQVINVDGGFTAK